MVTNDSVAGSAVSRERDQPRASVRPEQQLAHGPLAARSSTWAAAAFSVHGDLVQLANGSTLSLLSGPLAHGASNTLSINNVLCTSYEPWGVNVALTGGASAANVSLTNPIKGAGTVNIGSNAAAILVSGSGSTVKVGN